jgi:hypothetical protein
MADATQIVEELLQTREQLGMQRRSRQPDSEPQYFFDPDTGELKPAEVKPPAEGPRRRETPRPRPQKVRTAERLVD